MELDTGEIELVLLFIYFEILERFHHQDCSSFISIMMNFDWIDFFAFFVSWFYSILK